MPEQETQLRKDPTERTVYPGIPNRVLIERVLPLISPELVDYWNFQALTHDGDLLSDPNTIIYIRENSLTGQLEKSNLPLEGVCTPISDPKVRETITKPRRPANLKAEGTDRSYSEFVSEVPIYSLVEKPFVIHDGLIRFKGTSRAISYKNGTVTLIDVHDKNAELTNSYNKIFEDLFSQLRQILDQESLDIKLEQFIDAVSTSRALSHNTLATAIYGTLGSLEQSGIFPKFTAVISGAYTILEFLKWGGVEEDVRRLQTLITRQENALTSIQTPEEKKAWLKKFKLFFSELCNK